VRTACYWEGHAGGFGNWDINGRRWLSQEVRLVLSLGDLS